VTGGAGGVGAFAVQLAVILGAQVSATGRARDADYVRSLGAQAYTGSGSALPEKASGLDVIDTVGGAGLDAAYGSMRPGGRLVTPDPAELARLAELAGRCDPGRRRVARCVGSAAASYAAGAFRSRHCPAETTSTSPSRTRTAESSSRA
jgi:NADPH:quinone reductase-like Zn-dependent oxidoreductase